MGYWDTCHDHALEKGILHHMSPGRIVHKIIVLQAVLDKTFMQNYKQAKISVTSNLQRNNLYYVFDTV